MRRGGAEAARPCLPRDEIMRGRHGVLGAQDLRHRGVAAWPERLSRDFELFRLRRVPSTAHERALPAERGEGRSPCRDAEWLGPCYRPYARRGAGELSAR